MSELTAIITAAGESSRMADYGHKALLPWRGQPLVAHQVRTLKSAGFDTVVVVTGANSDAVAGATPDDATLVHNPKWQSGRSGSIETGADAIPDSARAVLVVAVDQPLSPRVLDALMPEAGAPVVQPADDEHGAGHPVILGGNQLDALRNIEREPEGLRSLVRRLRPEGTIVSVEDLPHWDLNTPQAYERARDASESPDDDS